MRELQLSLTGPNGDDELEVVDAELVASAAPVAWLPALSPSPPPSAPDLEVRNLFAEAERIAARAASASTRRQYRAIFRAFGDWLADDSAARPWSAISTPT